MFMLVFFLSLFFSFSGAFIFSGFVHWSFMRTEVAGFVIAGKELPLITSSSPTLASLGQKFTRFWATYFETSNSR